MTICLLLQETEQKVFFNGTIMSVRVYNRALTEEEIISNYNADLFMN